MNRKADAALQEGNKDEQALEHNADSPGSELQQSQKVMFGVEQLTAS